MFDREIESITIEVHVSRLRKKLGPGVIALTVANDGPGVPPEKLARSAERFERAGGAADGSGLGLPPSPRSLTASAESLF